MANKTKKEASVKVVVSSSRGRKRGRPRSTRSRSVREEPEEAPKAEHNPPLEEEPQSNGSPPPHQHPDTSEQEEPQQKRLKEAEGFVLSEQQRSLIQEDQHNKKIWDEALSFLLEGPNFLRKVEQLFMCVCCQELAFQPVTTQCSHNVCKDCLQRSFRAEVFTCPACRHDLGRDYAMSLNKNLQLLLDQFFPGYSKGR